MLYNLERHVREYRTCIEHKRYTGTQLIPCYECILGHVQSDVTCSNGDPISICGLLDTLSKYTFERLELEAEKRLREFPFIVEPECPICDQRVDHLVQGRYEPCCEHCAKLERGVES